MISYEERYNQVLAYIEANLVEELSLEHLSQHFHLSKYHFNRQFSAFFGLGLAAYIKKLRFKQASELLAFRTEVKIIDIAIRYAYESAEAFSRAFKDCYGQAPSDFRRQPDWCAWHKTNREFNLLRNLYMQNLIDEIKVNVIDFNEVQVAVLEHRGAPELLGRSLKKFIDWRKENKLPPTISRTFNLLYNDPVVTSPEDYRFDICASIESVVASNEQGVVNKIIPAGRCAVVRHVGSDDGLEVIGRYLYAQWLDQSGEELRDFPLFFERVSFFPNVPDNEKITDVYLPIK